MELTTEAREETAGTEAAGRFEGSSETMLLIADTIEDICEAAGLLEGRFAMIELASTAMEDMSRDEAGGKDVTDGYFDVLDADASSSETDCEDASTEDAADTAPFEETACEGPACEAPADDATREGLACVGTDCEAPLRELPASDRADSEEDLWEEAEREEAACEDAEGRPDAVEAGSCADTVLVEPGRLAEAEAPVCRPVGTSETMLLIAETSDETCAGGSELGELAVSELTIEARDDSAGAAGTDADADMAGLEVAGVDAVALPDRFVTMLLTTDAKDET